MSLPLDAVIAAPDGMEMGAFEEDDRMVFLQWKDERTGETFPDDTIQLVSDTDIKAIGRGELSCPPLCGDTLEVKLDAQYWLQHNIASGPMLYTEAGSVGCPANDVELYFSEAQWVRVLGHEGFQDIEGTVMQAYLSDEDAFFTHKSVDYIVWVKLEGGEQASNMLSQKTNSPFKGQKPDQIQVEWEGWILASLGKTRWGDLFW